MVYLDTYIHTYIHTYTYIHTNLHTCTQFYFDVGYLDTCIHTYIHINTYKLTYIHTVLFQRGNGILRYIHGLPSLKSFIGMVFRHV